MCSLRSHCMPEKNAKDFLLDTQLGSQTFSLDGSETEKDSIVLTIESEAALPTAMLDLSKKKLASKNKGGLYSRLDEWFQSLGKPSIKEKATFFRLIAIMINAGVPIIRSLDTIAEQTSNVRMRRMLFDIARGIEKGSTFSAEQQKFADFFTSSEIGMIKAAEASGQLNVILRDLARDVEAQDKLSRKIRGAMMYPAFVITVMIVVVVGMMVGVVPRLAEIFSNNGRELPLLTRVVMSISDFMVNNWQTALLEILIAVACIAVYKRTQSGSYFFDWLKIRAPIVGPITKKAMLARFSRMLSNLLKSGVAITKSLTICATSIGNEVYARRITLIGEDIARGIPLGESLRDTPEFPPMVVQMVSVGEETAQLDTMAAKIAEVYEDEVDTSVAALTKILEPILIVALGLIVAVVVFAIMMPIMDLANISG